MLGKGSLHMGQNQKIWGFELFFKAYTLLKN
jgi:hypothetical protein